MLISRRRALYLNLALPKNQNQRYFSTFRTIQFQERILDEEEIDHQKSILLFF